MNEWEKHCRTAYRLESMDEDDFIYFLKSEIREAFQEYCDKTFLANKEIINKILQSKNIEEI